MKNIAIIGIGPHAKRIYLHYFKKKKVNLELVVDLESEKDNIRKYSDEIFLPFFLRPLAYFIISSIIRQYYSCFFCECV